MERPVGLHDQVIVHPHGERVPQPGEAIPVASGIWWIRMPLPFALDHINLWILEDGDGFTLVDSGYGIQETFDLWEKHFAGVMAGRAVKNVVVTHYHPDHVGSAGWLVERTGAPFWMTTAEYLELYTRFYFFGTLMSWSQFAPESGFYIWWLFSYPSFFLSLQSGLADGTLTKMANEAAPFGGMAFLCNPWNWQARHLSRSRQLHLPVLRFRIRRCWMHIRRR